MTPAKFLRLIEEGDEKDIEKAFVSIDAPKKPHVSKTTMEAGMSNELRQVQQQRERAYGVIGVLANALRHAEAYIEAAPHGDNCYLSNHYAGDPGAQCNCGKESVELAIENALTLVAEAK